MLFVILASRSGFFRSLFVTCLLFRNNPTGPSGAVTGKVMDSEMAAKLSFTGRADYPCGEDFKAAPFLAAHPEFDWRKPILHDMIAGPWTTLSANERPAAATGN
jgi:hypothetical protein